MTAAIPELTFREVSDAETDYEALCAIRNRAWPDNPASVDVTRYFDQTRPPHLLHQRFEVRRGGQVVAFGAVFAVPWSHGPGRANIDWWADDADEAVICDHLLAWAQARDLQTVSMATREDQAVRLSILEARGFQHVLRAPRSAVDLETFDSSPWEGVRQRVLAAGIEIESAATVAARFPDWKRKLWVLSGHIEEDMPRPAGTDITWPPFEEWTRYIEGPLFYPEVCLIAVDGDEFVGCSQLLRKPSDPTRLHTAITGVEASHRRRGICTALKLAGIEFARAHGVVEIDTENEEGNPMFQINLRMGFVPRPAIVMLTREPS